MSKRPSLYPCRQSTLFDIPVKQKTEWSINVDGEFDYYADDAEAVVYLITEHCSLRARLLYVMKRCDACTFCSHPKTTGMGRGGKWSYAFTTYRRDWRDCLDSFVADDGRFNPLLAELGITPIYKKE